ncbi:MAG: EI24 domain-containing protein [Pseudomonadota bacterium]
MIRDALRAIGQLGDPQFRSVVLLGIGLSVGLLVGFSALVLFGLQLLVGPEATLPWIGTVTWLDDLSFWAAIPVLVVLSVVLMVPVASAFTGLFLDRIAGAVETRHYPNAPPPRKQGMAEMIQDSAQFLGLVLGVNLLALIAYVVFAPLALFIFWGVNGFLLGREYAQMSAARHLPPEEALKFRKRHKGQIFGAGVLMVIPLTIPIVNLLVPVLGAATFTHLFHRLHRP